MAKQVVLKKIELKVTANCCDGCRRKVKKALLGIEGVLRTDIDRLQPKVTVLGSMDPKKLIKKLSKVRKHAEILTYESQNSVEEMKKAEEPPMTKNKEKQKCENEQIRHSDACAIKIDKTVERKNNGLDGEKCKATEKEYHQENWQASNPEVIKNENPQLPKPESDNANAAIHPGIFNETRNMTASAQYGYVAEPYTINMPYYAIPSYRVTPLPQGYYGQPCLYHCERPAYRPMYQAPVNRVGDYFSDENAMGCHIM